MGSLALASEHDGAISSTATCPAAANGVDGLDAALGTLDSLADANSTTWDRLLPWLLDARTPALRGTLESLTPQASPNFDLISDLSIQFPFFTNSCTGHNTEIEKTAARDGWSDTAHIRLEDAPSCHSPFQTFFFSPSASTTSFAFSDSWASEEGPSSEGTAMPGQLLEPAAADRVPLPATDDYFTRPSTCAPPVDMATDEAQRRPQSARAGRPASPIFARWARRHNHSYRHHSGQLQPPAGRSSTESKVSGSSSTVVKQSPGRARSSSMQKRQSHGAGVPQMTREEFEALPLAIQRKYFSTLERLRFARDSGHVDGISQHYNDISHFKRRKPRQDRSVSEQITSRIINHPFLLEPLSPESSPSCATFSDRAPKREYSREEQVVLARRLRASVILDAADEAICKLNRRASKKHIPEPDLFSSSTSSRHSMDSHIGAGSTADRTDDRDIAQSFYETFRWMDEEEDLDLRLFLDDYHANLRDNMPSPTKQQPRPSFRRHLSISKIPFGRNSLSTSRPATKDATTPTSPLHSPSGSASNSVAVQGRRKSRALSLITPKSATQDSVAAFDPAAAHYQDPEARLKLRVYLASPQKFDEAIEFGFPSADALSAVPVLTKDGSLSQQRQARQKPSDGSSNMRTFLADDDEDDNVSLNSDQLSVADPESPKTPQAAESKPGPVRPVRVFPEAAHVRDGSRNVSESGGYAQAPASSREMTLRMTLTRPDLRAHEEQIYGWQQKQGLQQSNRKSTMMPPLPMESVTYIGEAVRKESMDRMASFDWSSTAADKGVMKRFWNRVRRS